jgi:hypothetical protein
MTRNQEIATEILNQLGGQAKIKLFTGASMFCAIQNGVSFKMGRKVVKIVLNPMDYYDVTVGHIYDCEFKIDAEEKDVFCEDLKFVVERMTGYYLSITKYGF